MVGFGSNLGGTSGSRSDVAYDRTSESEDAYHPGGGVKAASARLGLVVIAILLIAAAGGCSGDEPTPNQSGTLRGQVVVSGPLRGAKLSIDQLALETGEVSHVGDTTTDGDGNFEIPTGTHNGLLRIVARGGSFTDLATKNVVELDDASELKSLVLVDILEDRGDVLVGPVGHLIEARWQYMRGKGLSPEDAFEDATKHLNRHFAGVDWTRIQLANLHQPADSPTEPVRAAFIQAAFSRLAQDIAKDAESSEQEVNSYTLVKQWAEDLRGETSSIGAFDGEDRNNHAFNTGIQLGLGCKPVTEDCKRGPACPAETCHALCDQYAGTPRAHFATAMAAVIQSVDVERNPDAYNQTGLAPADLIPIARSINDNIDTELFGTECIEQLDRLPPSIVFLPPTPAEGGFAGGVVTIKVQGVDDIDAVPRTIVLGYDETDGDPNNAIAVAQIPTVGLDGSFKVEAQVRDSANNVVTASRTFTVDNVAPVVTLDPAGFIDVPNDSDPTWWTAEPTPILTGTVTDGAPVAVKAVVNGKERGGTVTGTRFTIELTDLDDLDVAGAEIAVVATDAALNAKQVVQRIRRDTKKPELSFQASTVTNEATETASFAPNSNPTHSHNGAPIDLAVPTPPDACHVLTKFSYLLDVATPEYVSETPARNPILYRLVAGDDGIGIVANSTRFRVRRREPVGPPTVVVDWTSTGAGTAIPGGARLFDLPIDRSRIADLNTREAIYDLDFETRDHFGRTSVPTARCFDLRLKAPPLKFETATVSSGHTFSLNSLTLDPNAPAMFRQIAGRLLNPTATGASLIDQKITNGTRESVFLTVNVNVPNPAEVTVSRSFVIRNHKIIDIGVDFVCPDDECGSQPAIPNPGLAPYTGTLTQDINGLTFPAKLFELNGAGQPTTEIPCVAPCSGPEFRFVVPPRGAGGAPARQFIVMTMIQPIALLRLTDANRPQGNVFYSDNTAGLSQVKYTGFEHYHERGCSLTQRVDGETHCVQEKEHWQFRALTGASLTFKQATSTTYSVSVNAQIAPTFASVFARPQNAGWAASIEPTLLPSHSP